MLERFNLRALSKLVVSNHHLFISQSKFIAISWSQSGRGSYQGQNGRKGARSKLDLFSIIATMYKSNVGGDLSKDQ